MRLKEATLLLSSTLAAACAPAAHAVAVAPVAPEGSSPTLPLMDLLLVSAPAAALCAAATLVMLIGAFWPASGRRALPWIALAGIAATGWATLAAPGAYEGPVRLLALDSFTVIFSLLVLAATAIAVLLSVNYVNREEMARGEYYSLMMFSSAGALLMAAADDLILLFMGLELLSIPLYVLAGFARGREQSKEAALKYFLLGAFASSFLVFGAALVFASVGGTGYHQMALGLLLLGRGADALLAAGVAMVLIALAFKVALVPFHWWTPDVYQGAPTPVTAFMSIVAKAAGFAALVRIVSAGAHGDLPGWNALLWALAAATMVWGNLLALAQQNVKRLLAYSSIGHAGYLLLGVLTGTVNGFSALVFYLAAYGVTTLGAFGVAAFLAGKGDRIETLYDYRGAARRHPFAGALMAVFLFSLAGIPPFAGFFAKLYLFLAALEQGYVGLTVIAVLTSVLAVYYYLRVSVMMWMEEPREEPSEAPQYEPARLSAAALAALAAGVTLLGIFSSPVLRWSDRAAIAAVETGRGAAPGRTGIGEAQPSLPPVDIPEPGPAASVPSQE